MLVARASSARRPGNGDLMITRTWKAIRPISTTSPITSIVTATHLAEWSSGSR